MLKTFYNTESEVPENLKGAYVARDGKYVLDELAEDHPVIVSKKTILKEKADAVLKVEGLEADLAAARQSAVQRGNTQVSKADAELLEKVKAHGTADEVVTKLTEYKGLKDETDTRKRADHLREVAKVLEYDNVEAFVRLPGLPEFEFQGEGDKRTVNAKVKGADGTVTVKPAKEYIERSADIAPFLPALKTTDGNGVKVHGTDGNSGSTGKDVFDSARAFGEAHNKSHENGADLHQLFGVATPA